MNNRRTISIIIILMIFMSFPHAFASEKPLHVMVSILPQKYFAERIGGEAVTVDVLVGPGQSPHSYEPTPKQMASLSKADVFFRIGVPFEQRLMEKIEAMLPDLNIVDTRKSAIFIRSEKHDHDGHDHGDMDPHIWMDPKRAKIIASNMAAELIRIAPSRQPLFLKNLDLAHQDLDRLDAKISALLKPFHGRSFMVFHPSYGYFADSYGLTQVAVEQDGKTPGPRQIGQWIDQAKKEKIRFILVQPQFSSSSARTIADAVGAKVLPVDPLAENYLENLETIADLIHGALQQP